MNDDGRKQSRRFTLRRRHLILAIMAVLAVVMGLYILISRGEAERRLAALRAAGYPTTFAELAEYTRLPEGTPNAADVYTRVFAAFVPPADEVNVPILGKAELPERGAPLPTSMVQAISQCLSANRECLALLHEAAGIEHCLYDWDYADSLLLVQSQSHWDGVKHCGFLLHLSTIFHAHQGDAEAAVACIRDGLQLAASMRREPGMIGYLIQIASRASALRGLEWALSATSFTDQQLAELDAMLAASAATLDLKETFITERCFAIERFRARERLKRPALKELVRRRDAMLWVPNIRGRGLPDTLDYMEKCVAAADLPILQRTIRFREIRREVESLSFLHAMAREWAPEFTGSMLFELDPRIHVHLDLARTALAIERYRLATGKVPDRLAELMPQHLEQVPIDPFDGQAIRYKRREPGYLLYSILQDGQDNGGRERDAVKSGDPYDWCFLVAR